MEHLANFSIGNSSKIFNLLSKHLYSDPLTASIREAGSNAIDASRENNIDPSANPIALRIYSDWACRDLAVISFTDRGVGISPERMSEFVANLGASSKTADDAQNGKFGIGMLAIFSLSDQFTIDTIVKIEGVLHQYQYIVFIGETGVPTYTQVLMRLAEERDTRTTVSFPAPDCDRDDIITACKEIWGMSSSICISTGDTPIVKPTRHLVAVGSNYRLVANGTELLKSLDQVATIVQIGDVIYPFFTEPSNLQSRAFRSYLDPQHYRQLERLVPKEDWKNLSLGYEAVFGRTGDGLFGSTASTRLRNWCSNRVPHTAALLYLQFAKNELSLPASRENIADNDANAVAIATRLAETIVEIARQVPINFKAHLAMGDLAASYHLGLKARAFLPTFDAAADMPLEWSLFSQSSCMFSTINWYSRSSPQCGYPPEAGTTDWIWVMQYLLSKPLTKIRLIAVNSGRSGNPATGSRSEIKSIAQLERTIGAKLSTLGDFICLNFQSQAQATVFAEMSQLGKRGYVWEFYNYAPAQPKSKPPSESASQSKTIKIPQSFCVIDSIAVAGTSQQRSIQFEPLLRTELNVVATDWHLPQGTWTPMTLSYLTILAHRLGISGSLIYTRNSELAAPDNSSQNLLAEIDTQVEAYLKAIAPQIDELGFIPGVNYGDVVSPRSYIHDWDQLIDIRRDPHYTTRQILFDRMEVLGVSNNEDLSQLSFCHTSRYLNQLIFHFYPIFATGSGQQFIQQFLIDRCGNNRFDDSELGLETLDIALKAIEQKFPLIRLCNGMKVSSAESGKLGFSPGCALSVSLMDSSIKLLTKTIENI